MNSDPALTATDAKALVAGYEDLRRDALGVRGPRRGIGFSLFLRSGMAAWMAACAAMPRPPESAVRKPAVAQLMPQDFRVEVATLLAEMALSAHAQGAMTT